MKVNVCLLSLVFMANAWGYGMGLSSYPLRISSKRINTEITGLMGDGQGLGIQGRYISRINRKSTFDLGFGFGGGDRTSRIFTGLDYEIFPDYKYQPRFSTRISVENAREFNKRKNILGVAPIVSKGYVAWGKEIYPFLSFPMGVSLDKETKTYDVMTAVSFGVNGGIPVKGYSNMTAGIEAQVNLNNSFSAIILSTSFPMK